MKCRYDPKYVSQYKSKHTKHVKFSKKVRFPLDTQKEYLNHEWTLLHYVFCCVCVCDGGGDDKDLDCKFSNNNHVIQLTYIANESKFWVRWESMNAQM